MQLENEIKDVITDLKEPSTIRTILNALVQRGIPEDIAKKELIRYFEKNVAPNYTSEGSLYEVELKENNH